jgi:AraC-like DNA-binding protein
VTTHQRPLDLITHRGDGTLIGAFRCPTNHASFRDSGPIQNDIFVFPRSSVRIRHAGGPAFVADQTIATIYNRGQIYDRAAVSEEGDRSDWFSVPRDIATEAVIANGLEPGSRGPFPFETAPVSDETYLAQRRLFRGVRTGMPAHEVDEKIYAILDDVVSAAAGWRSKGNHDDGGARELAAEIRSLISASFDEDWRLSRLERHFGMSSFRLCRAFRKATGGTIHGYLVGLRLRAALERLERPRVDIAGLAFDLGFSSHSHFSLAFSRAFGTTPSAWRSARIA